MNQKISHITSIRIDSDDHVIRVCIERKNPDNWNVYETKRGACDVYDHTHAAQGFWLSQASLDRLFRFMNTHGKFTCQPKHYAFHPKDQTIITHWTP